MLNKSSNEVKLAAVVPAAGIGSRMNADLPKQYLQIKGQAVITLTLRKLLECTLIDKIIVPLSENDVWFNELEISQHTKIETVLGGKERADSVLKGLNAIDHNEFQWTLVHDGARPCVPAGDIEFLIKQCTLSNEGGILAYPAHDTMKRAQRDKIEFTENRENLWHALTPQMFKTAELKQALVNALKDNVAITDEASAIEYAGKPCQLITASSLNIKITRPEDLKLAQLIMTAQETI